ncbi:unnamed protein product [Oikopleura dioica]|uniref:Uncharacterized protein n=1 Tax=Oikopleura dioica TaxID=34765 RepID=E4X7Z8_OIKDI|nr:unnamed protein product [Oikopleura dioica]
MESSLPFDPADLSKEASLLPPLPNDDQDQFSELRIMLIGIEEEDLLQILTDHDITAETFPFLDENDLLRMKIKNAEEVSEKISVFRDEKHRNLSAAERKFFAQFSTIFTESEQNKISANSVEQIKYLAAVVQFVKRKIRGNQGHQGILGAAF